MLSDIMFKNLWKDTRNLPEKTKCFFARKVLGSLVTVYQREADALLHVAVGLPAGKEQEEFLRLASKAEGVAVGMLFSLQNLTPDNNSLEK